MTSEEYHNFDLKQPFDNKNDMRTAYYRGHRHIRDPPQKTSFGIVPQPEYVYSRPLCPDMKNKSESKTCYTWKPTAPNLIRKPHIDCTQVHGIKYLDEKNYKTAPKPIEEYRTVKNIDYTQKDEQIIEKPVLEQPPAYNYKRSDAAIDPSKPGYSKHLDMMLTTNSLNYHNHNGHPENELAQNDILTVWNWLGYYNKKNCGYMNVERPLVLGTSIKKQLYPSGPIDLFPKHRSEFPSMINHVPYSGLTSEQRDNYKLPVYENKFHVELITPLKIPQENVVPYMSFNRIYGSGDPVDKFVSIKDINKLIK